MRAEDPIPENCIDTELLLMTIWGTRVPFLGDPLSWTEALTVRPLAAISGRVRVAGVVSRLRALVSCSITASIS